MADLAYQIELDGKAVDDPFYGDVMTLTVEENTDTASTLRLRLLIALQDDGSWNYLDDDRLTPFKKVKVLIGYTGGSGLAGALGGLTGGGGNDAMEPVFEGYITATNLDVGGAPNDSAIEVSASDTCVLMGLEEKAARWPDLSDGDIAQKVLKGYVADVKADPTPTAHKETVTTVVQRGTDLQFVRDLARKNGVEFYFETEKSADGPTAYFRAPQLDGTPQPDLAVQFGDDSNLVRVSVRLSGVRPLNVKARQIDVAAGSANSAQAGTSPLTKLGGKDANDLLAGPLGSLVTAADAPAQMLLLGPPTADPAELKAVAQAARDEAGWFLTATGEVNTDAYQTVLRPRRLVLIKGVGSTYSGAYYVRRVVHELRIEGTYTQTFEARRNARDLKGDEKFGGGGLASMIPGV